MVSNVVAFLTRNVKVLEIANIGFGARINFYEQESENTFCHQDAPPDNFATTI